MKNVSFKNYRIITKLGQGGMATVYLAEHNLLGNKVAIKILNKEFLYNSNIKNRFISEARKLAQLDHPNIVRVVDLLDNEAQVAFVMEYLDGKTLKDILQQKKLNDDEIESILNQMISALEYIHEEGLIHRDIKPSNFIFDKRANLKLTDFGISKDTSVENSEYTQTATHINMGTPMYMSPEQIRSLKDVTKLTDIYSLGVVLWEMVTDKKPYNTQTLSSFDLQLKIVNENLPLTYTKWDGVIQKATQKAEEDRLYNLKYFLYPEQIELEEGDDDDDDDDEKTVIYSNKQKETEKKKHSNNSKERKKKKRGFSYFLIIMAVLLIVGLILQPNMEKKRVVNKELSSEELSRKEKEIPYEGSIKYRVKIKNSNGYMYLSNLKNEDKIREFLKADDEENWEIITYLFSDKVEKHWNKIKPTYEALYNRYHDDWVKTSYRSNEVKSIKKLNTYEYIVELINFTNTVSNDVQRQDYNLYFKFDEIGKITVIDEFNLNNIKTLTRKKKKKVSNQMLFEKVFKNSEELESGLRIHYIEKNDSEKPKYLDKAGINYAGYLTDGTLFDSNLYEVVKENNLEENIDKNNDYFNTLNLTISPELGIIPGFKEAILKMKYAEKVYILIPPHLAYGENEAPEIIPPNSELVFYIEMHKVE